MLIRADNGDVITFDDTGLTLRLSDRVLADLRDRLGLGGGVLPDASEVLGDIDAWHLREAAGWYRFTACLDASRTPREYQRPVAGGDIIASAPGPLHALFSLGGARRAGFREAAPDFAHHVLAPGDDIGAVGLEGTDAAVPTGALQRIAHATRDALIADTLLAWRRDAHCGLPLFVVRAETDGSARLADLGQGRAYANFLTSLDNICSAAASLGKRPRVLSVGIDLTLEDIDSTPAQFAEAFRALMRRIERDMGARDLQRPVFLATFEAGTQEITDHAAIRAHGELAVSPGPHDLVFSAPGYMFAQTRFGRPTDAARARMAEMDAHALVARTRREAWGCPMFLLAETEGAAIRVTGQAMTDLVIDPADPFGAGPGCGFRLAGTVARISSVAVAPDDAKALIVTCDRVPDGPNPELRYAAGAPPRAGDHPANCGSVRDLWSAPSRSGGPLHRWACPAVLPIRRGAD